MDKAKKDVGADMLKELKRLCKEFAFTYWI